MLDTLHPLARKLLYVLGNEQYITSTILSFEHLEDEIPFSRGQYNQAQSALIAAGLLQEVSRIPRSMYECTEYGKENLEGEGLLELRMLEAVESKAHSMASLAEAFGVAPADIGTAFGRLRKLGALSIRSGETGGGEQLVVPGDKAVVLQIRQLPEYMKRGTVDTETLSPEFGKILALFAKKRGAGTVYFRFVEREEVRYRLSESGVQAARTLREQGDAMPVPEITTLTPEIIRAGTWKDKQFRPYNVHVPPAKTLMGRRNPYTEYLDEVRDKLVALGFEEFDGSLAETDFWNSDALFMPQFHSARDIHDVYYVKHPNATAALPEPWAGNVAAAHEHGGNTGSRGWMYSFDYDMARRIILRSQGTVLSAKTLPAAKVPGKYFGIVRCFRHDQVDATHLSDFYQVEGIVLGKDVNLRTLLGMLEIFARELADAKEVRFVPGYFPFTEPSVEVHIKHPKLGWFELGGSGVFRPEVTLPLGVTVPVLAWGLGIDRMALMRLGLNDLRDLFSGDIDTIRNRRKREHYAEN